VNCPACKNEPMIVLELDEVEIDYCISCKGIWLDAGELELLLGDAGEKEALLASFKLDSANKEKSLKCPICRKRMAKALFGEEQQVRIDKCRRNDGLWFDEGELEQVIAMKAGDKENSVLNLLKNMFGKDKQ
jgi:Zn-finger nucleic acid-binding protein